MFEYIKGTLAKADPIKAIIDVQGVGYKIFIPLSTYAKLPNIGEKICLLTSYIVREDAHILYGFLTTNEKELFELAITISGIGPKTGLALVGHLDAAALQSAILRADISLLCKVPGIGKKTAERLIIEMRDKLKGFDKKETLSKGIENSIVSDAISALMHLGYNPMQAQKAVASALKESEEPKDASSLITRALRKI